MPQLILFGSSYSTAYTYKSMCDRNKLFAVLIYKVNCLLGTCRGSFYLGSSYSTAYTYKSMCERNKLFAVLIYKVNCLLGTCYLKYKYFYEDYQMKLLNINDL